MKKIILMMGVFTLALLQAEVRPMIQMSIDGGGDKLVTAQLTTGKEELYAGSGLSFEGGIEFDTIDTDVAWKTQLLLGYKFSLIDASNASVDMTRVMLTAMELYHFEAFILGAGVTYHVSPTLSSDGDARGLDVDFDSAWGGMAQIGYAWTERFSMGLKATWIDYDVSDTKISVDANNVGIYMSYKF